MLAERVVGLLLLGEGQSERRPQDRLAQRQGLAIERRAIRRGDDLNVVLVRVRCAHGVAASCSAMVQIALICGASLPR